jgi:hypothetical protein
MYSLAECTDSEVTAKKSRKIRLFLNPEQKALLKEEGSSSEDSNVT